MIPITSEVGTNRLMNSVVHGEHQLWQLKGVASQEQQAAGTSSCVLRNEQVQCLVKPVCWVNYDEELKMIVVK